LFEATQSGERRLQPPKSFQLKTTTPPSFTQPRRTPDCLRPAGYRTSRPRRGDQGARTG
jgi:hypothetical protein